MFSPSRPASVAQMTASVSGALSRPWTIFNWLAVRGSDRNSQRSGIMGSGASDQRPDQATP